MQKLWAIPPYKNRVKIKKNVYYSHVTSGTTQFQSGMELFLWTLLIDFHSLQWQARLFEPIFFAEKQLQITDRMQKMKCFLKALKSWQDKNFQDKLEGKAESQRGKGSPEVTEDLCQPGKIRILVLVARITWPA